MQHTYRSLAHPPKYGSREKYPCSHNSVPISLLRRPPPLPRHSWRHFADGGISTCHWADNPFAPFDSCHKLVIVRRISASVGGSSC